MKRKTIVLLSIFIILLSDIFYYLYTGQKQDEILGQWVSESQMRLSFIMVLSLTFLTIVAFSIKLIKKQFADGSENIQVFSFLYLPVALGICIITNILSNYTYFWSRDLSIRLYFTFLLAAGFTVSYILMHRAIKNNSKSRGNVLFHLAKVYYLYSTILLIVGLYIWFVTTIGVGPHG